MRAERTVKVIVLGDNGVGKTALVDRLCNKGFSTRYKSTIGVGFAYRKLPFNETEYNLQFWDISGQERFGNMFRVYAKEAQAAIFVVDPTQEKTLKGVEKWAALLNDFNLQNIIKVLVVNQIDKLPAAVSQNQEEDMDQLRRRLGASAVFYCSAKENKNIEEVFIHIVQELETSLDNENIEEVSIHIVQEEQSLIATPPHPLDTDDNVTVSTHVPLLRNTMQQDYNEALQAVESVLTEPAQQQIKRVIQPWLQKMRTINRNDKQLLAVGTTALYAVRNKLQNPAQDSRHEQALKLFLQRGTTTDRSFGKEIGGMALMALGILGVITSVAMIATLKLAPAGLLGLGISKKLITLGATWYGLTALGATGGVVASAGIFGGNALRKSGNHEAMKLSDLTSDSLKVSQALSHWR